MDRVCLRSGLRAHGRHLPLLLYALHVAIAARQDVRLSVACAQHHRARRALLAAVVFTMNPFNAFPRDQLRERRSRCSRGCRGPRGRRCGRRTKRPSARPALAGGTLPALAWTPAARTAVGSTRPGRSPCSSRVRPRAPDAASRFRRRDRPSQGLAPVAVAGAADARPAALVAARGLLLARRVPARRRSLALARDRAARAVRLRRDVGAAFANNWPHLGLCAVTLAGIALLRPNARASRARHRRRRP